MNMKKLFISTTLILSALTIALSVHIYAQGNKQNRILLVEMQPGSAISATDEFVELYNDGFTAQKLQGWKVQYKSASGSTWQTKAELTGTIAPGGRYLVSTFNLNSYPRQDTLTSGMAQDSGHIRLINSTEEEIDMLGWGSATLPLVLAAASPEKEFSLKRRTDEDGFFSAEDNNFEDWFISEEPSPQGDTWKPAEVPVAPTNPTSPTAPSNPTTTTPKPTTPKPTTGGSTTTTTPKNKSTAKIVINEFLPDPESPQKDSDDEFVELYNPNNSPVNLADYALESGSNYRYSYTLPKVTIAAHSYLALFSIDTGLTLPNNGSQLRLLSPAGLVLSEFVYDSSEPGQSWVKTEAGEWTMSTTPTPNAKNKVSNESSESGSTASSSESEKTVSDNATNLSSGSVLGANNAGTSTGSGTADANQPRNLNSAILAGVGLLAVLYAVYEYRHDIGNRIEQFRGYLKNRRENRRSS